MVLGSERRVARGLFIGEVQLADSCGSALRVVVVVVVKREKRREDDLSAPFYSVHPMPC